MSSFKVLIFPGGTEIGLEVGRALSYCKDVKIAAASADVPNHAPFVFNAYFTVPPISEVESCVGGLNEIIAREAITHIIPAYDDAIIFLSQNATELCAKVVTSPPRTCDITRSKRATYQALRGFLPTPKVFSAVGEVNQYPVFLKPDRGQGSQNAFKANNRAELEYILSRRVDFVISEFLPGAEYTIDCFSDRDLGLLFCQGRERVQSKNGISVDSRLVAAPEFHSFAKIISSQLEFHGAWFFQVKKDTSGGFKLLEIGPRIAGTMALNRARGINFPLLSIYESERIPIEIMVNEDDIEISRALTNRYSIPAHYSTVYVDLDDTLIFEGTVNTQLVRFLYQCLNYQIKLILITKHKDDVTNTLRHYRLGGLFDDIVKIGPTAEKSDVIGENKSAILIDDSFSERKRVYEKCGLRTYDCSMLESLMNDRT